MFDIFTNEMSLVSFQTTYVLEPDIAICGVTEPEPEFERLLDEKLLQLSVLDDKIISVPS